VNSAERSIGDSIVSAMSRGVELRARILQNFPAAGMHEVDRRVSPFVSASGRWRRHGILRRGVKSSVVERSSFPRRIRGAADVEVHKMERRIYL